MSSHRTDQYALADCTAHELVQLFRTGQASPLEAASAVFGRMDRVDGKLNAFCHMDPEGAAQAARASTQRWQQGAPLGPLDGVPVSLQDMLLTTGLPTRCGSATVARVQDWTDDAPVTARLRAAGAVILGKTNTPEFASKCETNSPLNGITRNPWNPAHTSGGASGGAAAAVAAGMGPLAMGTDAAGSLRVPAAFCGAVGFKPSFGRVPAYPPSLFGSLSHVGPITMSVLDTAMVMNVVKQPDVRDWSALPPDGRDYLVGLNDGVRGLRIAWSPTLGYAHSVHADVAAASLRAAEAFVEMGAHVEQVDPGIADPLELAAALLQLGAWHTWSALTPAQRAQTDPDFAAQAQLGARLSTLDVQDLQLQRAALGARMRQFMAGYDLLLTPAVAVPAFDALPAGHRPVDAQSMLGWSPFSYPFNLTQQPACSIPCGLSGAGLPIGLQIVGPMFGDALVLRAARAYESHRPLARPPLASLV